MTESDAIPDVEAFEAMMRDCRAHRGIIVCASGFTEGAKRRAQAHIGLGLVPLEDLEKLDLTAWENCRGICSLVKSRRARKGWVLYDQPFGLAIGDSPLTVLVVGKCDECRNFHIWCWTCGSKFALNDEAEHHCGCDRSLPIVKLMTFIVDLRLVYRDLLAAPQWLLLWSSPHNPTLRINRSITAHGLQLPLLRPRYHSHSTEPAEAA